MGLFSQVKDWADCVVNKALFEVMQFDQHRRHLNMS